MIILFKLNFIFAENTTHILNQGGTILKNSNKDNLFNYAYRDEKGCHDTVIVVSEGAKPKDGNIVIKKIVADSADTIRLGGIGDQLASQLEVLLGGKEIRATNIGHVQRGGETSNGGNHNVDPNGFVVKTARNIGISFGN